MDDWQKWQAEVFKRAQEQYQDARSGSPLSSVVVLGALLALSSQQVYTCVQLANVKESQDQHIAAQSDGNQAALKEDLEKRLADLELASKKTTRNQKNDERREDLHAVAGRVDSTQEQLQRSISTTQKLRADQERSVQELGHQLATKADQQQVGILSQDVADTREDLDSAKRKLQETIAQLGMTRSELGTLIARNHDEIGKLRKLGERDYFEFTLNRSQIPQVVAGVGLQLKKTDVKRMHYTIDVYANDYRIEKKDRGVNEPIFFYVRDSRQPIELVINELDGNRATGYLSALKGTMLAGYARADTTDDPDWEPFGMLKKRTEPVSQNTASPIAGSVPPNW